MTLRESVASTMSEIASEVELLDDEWKRMALRRWAPGLLALLDSRQFRAASAFANAQDLAWSMYPDGKLALTRNGVILESRTIEIRFRTQGMDR